MVVNPPQIQRIPLDPTYPADPSRGMPPEEPGRLFNDDGTMNDPDPADMLGPPGDFDTPPDPGLAWAEAPPDHLLMLCQRGPKHRRTHLLMLCRRGRDHV